MFSPGANDVASSISVLHGVSVVTVVSVACDWNSDNGFYPSPSCGAELLTASVSILFGSRITSRGCDILLIIFS